MNNPATSSHNTDGATGVLAALRLDVSQATGGWGTVVGLSFICGAFSAATVLAAPESSLPFGLFAFIAMPLTSLLSSMGQADNGGMMRAVFPLSRRDVVYGRYLLAGVIAAIVLVVHVVVSALIGYVMHTSPGQQYFSALLTTVMATMGIAAGLRCAVRLPQFVAALCALLTAVMMALLLPAVWSVAFGSYEICTTGHILGAAVALLATGIFVTACCLSTALASEKTDI
ncbi:Uncharacterised protein [Dermatophilus congolensis]|uniref:ABC-2 family transporter protein n=1 Tax=Dermatophilus congolensis TaxID=1863 RepID=A0A239VI29_9MICO|nr:ABC-2 transporter permease [Dermatophilus congolensis]SNV21931.1 Uncharacterised protein [Dermatophilus congolensis]